MDWWWNEEVKHTIQKRIIGAGVSLFKILLLINGC